VNESKLVPRKITW